MKSRVKRTNKLRRHVRRASSNNSARKGGRRNTRATRAVCDVWHLSTVTLPKRAINGELVWGTVLRRYERGRWIYKKYIGAQPTLGEWP